MKCEMIRDLLPGYIDGLTSQGSNEEIERHLQECGACKKYLEEMNGVIAEQTSENHKKEINPFLKLKQFTVYKMAAVAVIMLIIGCITIEIGESKLRYTEFADMEDMKEIQCKNIEGVTLLTFVSANEQVNLQVAYHGSETENKVVDGKEAFITLEILKQGENVVGEPLPDGKYELIFTEDGKVSDLHIFTEPRAYDEDDFIAICFVDGVKTIKLNDLKDNEIE